MFLATGISKNGIGIITSQIGRGASPHSGSSFFTTPQRDKIKSSITLAAGGHGRTHRRVQSDVQSISLTNFYRKRGWVGSPYEADMAIPIKRTASMKSAKNVTRGR